MVVAPEHPLVDRLVPQGDWPDGTPELWKGPTSRRAPPPRRRSRHTGVGGSRKAEVERQTEGKDKTGVFTGSCATNPVNGERDPGLRRRLRPDGLRHRRDHGRARTGPPRLGVRDEVRASPDHPHGAALTEGYAGDGRVHSATGPAINSANDESRHRRARRSPTPRRGSSVTGGQGARRGPISYRLRDWLFSRQRYWGEPFPVIFDDDGVAHVAAGLDAAADPAGRARLRAQDLRPGRRRERARSRRCRVCPNGSTSSWTWGTAAGCRSTAARRTRCRTGRGRAGTTCATSTRRTTRRSSTRRTSAYWMGRSDTPVARAPPGARDPGGVDLYIGGVEHGVLHLLYARFWHKVLFDLGHLSSEEPFRTYFSQGYIQAPPTGTTAVSTSRPMRRSRSRAAHGAETVFTWQGVAGDPRVRQDRQVAEEHGQPRTRCTTRTAPTPSGSTRCRWARWSEQAMGDPRRRRRASGSCSGCGATSSTRPTGSARVADTDPERGTTHARCTRPSPAVRGGRRAAALQHGDGQAHRAEQRW